MTVKKIIRSQLYQLVLDKAIFIILLPWLISAVSAVVEIEYDVSLYPQGKIPPGSLVFAKRWLYERSDTAIYAYLIGALLMAKDLVDKTINYEILSGRTRSQVFFSRFLTALAINEVMMLIQLWSYPLIYIARFGWGRNMAPSDAAAVTLCLCLYVFRITAETALFAVLLRRKNFTYFLPLLLFMIGSVIGNIIFSELSYVATNERYIPEWVMRLTDIFTYGIYTTIIEIPGENIVTDSNEVYELYRAYSSVSALAEMILMTFGAGAVMLAAAYRKFSGKDLE